MCDVLVMVMMMVHGAMHVVVTPFDHVVALSMLANAHGVVWGFECMPSDLVVF